MTADDDRPGEPAAVAEPVAQAGRADHGTGDEAPYAHDRPSVAPVANGHDDPTPGAVVATSPPLVTGNDTVDEALLRLADLDQRPTAEHAEVYEDIQGRLQRALADLDGR